VKDTRTPERFTAVGGMLQSSTWNRKRYRNFLELLKAHHTTVDVTLGAFEGMVTGRPGKVSPEFAAVCGSSTGSSFSGARIPGVTGDGGNRPALQRFVFRNAEDDEENVRRRDSGFGGHGWPGGNHDAPRT